jgi:EF hand
MKATKFWTRSGVVLSLAGAAMLSLALPAGAQSTTPTTPPSTTKSATPSTAPSTAPMTAPARKGDDDAAEFAKLDKNHDGALDKAEAMMEPRLLAKFADADTNKDGKIDQQEFLNFYKNNPRASAK